MICAYLVLNSTIIGERHAKGTHRSVEISVEKTGILYTICKLSKFCQYCLMKSIWPRTYGFLTYTVKFYLKILVGFNNNVNLRNAAENQFERDIDIFFMRRAHYLGHFNSIFIDFKSTKFKCKYAVMYIMAFLHISAKFFLNVSVGFHDMSILITVRVSIWIESQTNMQW